MVSRGSAAGNRSPVRPAFGFPCGPFGFTGPRSGFAWEAERAERPSGRSSRRPAAPSRAPRPARPWAVVGSAPRGKPGPVPSITPDGCVRRTAEGPAPPPPRPCPPRRQQTRRRGRATASRATVPSFFLFFLLSNVCLLLPMKSHILLKNPRGVFLKYDQKEGRRQARADAVAFRGPARGLGGFGGKAREQGAVRLSRNWPARHPSRSRPVTEIGGSSRAGRRPLNLPGAWLAPLDTEESSSVTDR